MLPPRDGVREVATELTAYLDVLTSRLPVGAMVVVGSRARNDHWRDSDIDLVVVSQAFADMARAERIDLLLSAWNGRYALEPHGYTPDELKEANTLFLWETLADGRPVRDEGIFAEARESFRRRLESGDLERTAHGWRELRTIEARGRVYRLTAPPG